MFLYWSIKFFFKKIWVDFPKEEKGDYCNSFLLIIQITSMPEIPFLCVCVRYCNIFLKNTVTFFSCDVGEIKK